MELLANNQSEPEPRAGIRVRSQIRVASPWCKFVKSIRGPRAASRSGLWAAHPGPIDTGFSPSIRAREPRRLEIAHELGDLRKTTLRAGASGSSAEAPAVGAASDG
jgi:hypothetical protein